MVAVEDSLALPKRVVTGRSQSQSSMWPGDNHGVLARDVYPYGRYWQVPGEPSELKIWIARAC